MSLKSIDFQVSYDKNEGEDIPSLLYRPCLENSILFRRVTAYYRLSVLPSYLDALPKFLRNGGKIQIVCSPVMELSDVIKIMQAINDGAIESAFIKVAEDTLLREIEASHGKESKEIDEIISLLIRLGSLEIKIAIPKNGGLMHKKKGYFQDSDGNTLTFSGSSNETENGLDPNGNDEYIEIATNWEGKNKLTETRISIIDDLWNETNPNTKVFDLPKCVEDKLLRFTEGTGNGSRDQVIAHLEKLVEEYARKNVNKNIMPGIKLRKHQQEAIKNWLNSGRRGIFDHCTGSGKTLTAIWLILDSLRRRETPLIIVPKKLLLNYWDIEIRKFLKDQNVNILLCGDGNNQWKSVLPLELCSRDIRNDSTKELYVIIAVDKTVCGKEFQNRIQKGEHLFIVGDECHNYGSNKNSAEILTMECGPRLGLSATPNRHGDDLGSKRILEYFGDIIPPVVSIKDGISAVPPFLSRYYYYPHFCELSDKEIQEYEDLTKRIARKYGGKSDIEPSEFKQDILFFLRAKIIKKAESKIALAVAVLKEHYKDGQKWIVFCEDEQIYNVDDALRKENIEPRMIYLSKDKDRQNAFDFFANHSGIILAIKCLDEGVDIPNATHALLLASSQNPAQFIQRRGRVLRIAEGKEYAYIYDAFLKPPKGKRFDKVLHAEISRGMEFAQDASNAIPSTIRLTNILNEYKHPPGEFIKDDSDFEKFSTPDSPVIEADTSEEDQ